MITLCISHRALINESRMWGINGSLWRRWCFPPGHSLHWETATSTLSWIKIRGAMAIARTQMIRAAGRYIDFKNKEFFRIFNSIFVQGSKVLSWISTLSGASSVGCVSSNTLNGRSKSAAKSTSQRRCSNPWLCLWCWPSPWTLCPGCSIAWWSKWCLSIGSRSSPVWRSSIWTDNSLKWTI